MLRKVVVEVEQSDPDLYEVVNSVPLPELKCGDTGHAYVVLKLVEGNAAEPAAFSCELKFQVCRWARMSVRFMSMGVSFVLFWGVFIRI